MIKDMIVKLMEEATEEAEHKGFCDQELATNEHTRKEKTEQTEILTAENDQATIADAKAAGAATQQAMKVLKEFYAKASAATSLAQTKATAGQPEIFDDTPYTGMGGDSGGVMG